MTRTRVRHRCEACGATSPKWLGRCPECGEWGSLVEEPGGPADERRAVPAGAPPSLLAPLAEIDVAGTDRRATGVGELDRVLGGGLVAGSVTLIGGEPGIGKSTLLLQALAAMAAAGARCLLVTGEESPAQVRRRAERLGSLAPSLLVVAETSLPWVLAHAENAAPDVLALDSVQTLHDPDLPGAAGSVAQVREGAQRIVQYAKERGVATLLVGHVTKDGALAGPRALEHVVDTVLSFEGDRHHALRMLRAVKHRFGATGELGILEMAEEGLRAVPDASAMFLADRQPGACGSVIAPVLDGNRSLLVEVQALVAPTHAPIPRRVAQSLDGGRVSMLTAVLGRRAGVELGTNDIYVNIAGGARASEPGADLAIALAIAAAAGDQAVADDTVVLGEVGLGGELRQVAQTPRRLSEAARHGFARAVVPASTPDVAGIRLVRAADLRTALTVLQSVRSVRVC